MTRIGLFLRATGDNEFMVQGLGVNTNFLFVIGLGLSNGLVALSGAFVAQSQGFADVSMGTGLIITGIAALILGEGLISAFASIRKMVLSKRADVRGNPSGLHLLPWSSFGELVAAAVGSFVYFLIVAICLRIGLAPTDLKLATGVLVILAVALQLRHTGAETYARGRL
jgi:putative ABC transport system permease protein